MCRKTALFLMCMALLFPFIPRAQGLAVPAVIVIDAGHGGEDGGAVSADGTPESGINLAIARKLELILCFLGYETVMTRNDENAVYSPDATTLREKKVSDLKNRVALVNGTERGWLISIHQNSLPSHSRVHGAQVFYNGILEASDAAYAVQDCLNQAVNGGNEKMVSPIDASIYLMKESQRPSLLVECGFMSNDTEYRLLKQESYQFRLATAIAAGFSHFTSDKTARSVANES